MAWLNSFAGAERRLEYDFVVGPDADTRLGGGGLVVSPGTLDFGSIRKGTARTKTITIQNLGTETATVQLPKPPAPFSITAPAGGSVKVPGSQTQSVTVQFKPTKKGSFSATLSLKWVEQNKSFAVKLQGKGL